MDGYRSSYQRSNQGGPILPPELEREIFEWAATAYPSCSPAIIIVAQRVKQWIEPSLYKVLMLTMANLEVNYPAIYQGNNKEKGSPLSKTITYKAGAYAEHVLVQGGTAPEIEDLLKRCSKVRNLAIWNFDLFESLIPTLQSLQLERLSIEVENLVTRDGERLIFDHTPFTNLTHLDVILNRNPDLRQWDRWENLALLPNLTHLAFNKSTPQFIKGILAGCKMLNVLILLHDIEDPNDSDHHEITHCDRIDIVDKRLVELRIDMALTAEVDWKSGAHGGDDFWVKAENIVVERHRQEGEINVRTFYGDALRSS